MDFCNIAHILCTESAANTLTFKKLETGISISSKVAWIIHKLEYFLGGVQLASVFDTNADYLALVFCASNTFTDPDDQSNPAILDSIQVRRVDFGTAATGGWAISPFMKDFSMLPGGGLLVPPNPLYLAAKGTGLASATTSRLRLFYSQVELKTDEFWQLLEMYRLVSS